MKTQNEKSISVLKNLIEVSKDGQEGFRKACLNVDDVELKSLFEQYSTIRGDFVSELETRIRKLGGIPEEKGSVAGALHRSWIDVKAAVTPTSNEGHAILAECERGEDSAVEKYRSALDEYVDGSTRELIRRQYTLIQATHERIKTLRDSALYAGSHSTG